MAFKLQYNKTFIQQLQKQLSIREKALPTLKSKETALRVEVKKIGDRIGKLEQELKNVTADLSNAGNLWLEYPGILKIEKVDINIRNIAGVKVPEFAGLEYRQIGIHIFHQPAWIPMGTDQLKKLIRQTAEIKVERKKYDLLNYARKKTTQKVNLYEKVQIPEFRDGILKIKRYLEDQENLSKSAQKIIKERNRLKEAAL